MPIKKTVFGTHEILKYVFCLNFLVQIKFIVNFPHRMNGAEKEELFDILNVFSSYQITGILDLIKAFRL